MLEGRPMFSLATILVLGLAQSPPDVPLKKWTHPDFPAGINFGASTGISFGDFDGDGFSDIFCYSSGHLWRNLDGASWVLANDLDPYLPPAGLRYGAAFADYDNDGLADIGVEPRLGSNDDCFHLLKNLGGAVFVDIAPYSALIDQQLCGANSETLCWGDVDGDGDLDLFIPIYPQSINSIGNKFLHNRGPTGPKGLYRFTEEAATAGVTAPPNANRPEGTFMVDLDDDGDLELYSNGTLYRNDSGLDAPLFAAFDPIAIGIRKQTIVDEGVYIFDYDLDGDLDVMINYTGNHGIRIWESRGDGTWFQSPSSTIEDFRNGATFGMSVADFDGDGDLDMQALDTFRRNMMMESGQKYFELATHNIDPIDLRGATVAWGDWDRDGDMDAAVGAGIASTLLENTSFDASTPASERTDLRVRVVNNSPDVPRGLETEYGAVVEVIVHGDEAHRRLQVVSSASGYLTQNEYALSFSLPSSDSSCEIVVNFPSLPQQGFKRVDKFVNPLLGALDLSMLNTNASSPDLRELSVFRDGSVLLFGVHYQPLGGGDIALLRSNSLVAPSLTTAPPDPTMAAADEHLGMEIEVHAGNRIHLKEVVIDAVPTAMRIWDVTNPAAPSEVSNGYRQLSLASENRRGSWPLDIELGPGTYRIVAAITQIRESQLNGPIVHSGFSVNGGLRFIDNTPASGAAVAAAQVDPNLIGMALKVAGARPDWVDIGGGTSASLLNPSLHLSGQASANANTILEVTGTTPGSSVVLVAGRHAGGTRLGRLTVLPAPEQIAGPFITDFGGKLNLPVHFPANLGSGTPWLVQALVREPGGVGFHATNVMGAVSR